MISVRSIMPGPTALAVTLLLAAMNPGGAVAQSSSLDIPFAPTVDSSITDPDNPAKVFRMDLARVEHQFPLSRADLMKITPENLATLSQEQIDQIYGRLTAGPIPDGQYLGDLFFARGESLRTRLEEIVGGIEGRIIGVNVGLLEKLGGLIWKGKEIKRDQRILRNMIEDFAVLGIAVDNPEMVPKTTIPREGPLRRIIPKDEVFLLFPAKIYCGQSLLDARRESVIVDYSYNDDIEGYRKSPDSLAGRGGLRIRDEIRMVRPGLYLGRAYANRAFLLNFTLFNAEVAAGDGPAFARGDAVAEDCWPGEQRRASAIR
jgi:hypothetical protein